MRTIWDTDDATAATSALENLPEDILHQIVAKLPLRTFLRLRGVSKHYCTLTFPASPPPAPEPLLALAFDTPGNSNSSTSRDWATYSFETRRWARMPPLPPQVHATLAAGERVDTTSSGGLLFFTLSSYSHSSSPARRLVFNPVTRATRALETLNSDWLCGAFSHPIAHPTRNAYEILIADQEHWAQYASPASAWSQGAIAPSAARRGALAGSGAGVQWRDLVFFVAPTMRGKSDLATFHARDHAWLETFDYEGKHEVGLHLSNRAYAGSNRLFEWAGALALLTTRDGCVATLDVRDATGGRELDGTWLKRLQVPPALLKEFESVQGCVACGEGRLCVVGRGRGVGEGVLVVVYCKEKDAWEKLPPCPHEMADAQAFLFEPSLMDV